MIQGGRRKGSLVETMIQRGRRIGFLVSNHDLERNEERFPSIAAIMTERGKRKGFLAALMTE
jgi:hypothetical protein